MENMISRGAPPCNIPYHSEMNYQQQNFTHRRSEDNLVERNNSAPEYNQSFGRGKPVNEEIVCDHHLATNPPTNTEKQLDLSDEIYGLKMRELNMRSHNTELLKEIQFLKEQNSLLSDKLNSKVIVDLKNYEEEKRQWKLEREELESKVSLCNGIIRGLNEDKVHMGEKISMLEMNLARPVYYPPAQTPHDYSYNPRDGMSTEFPQGNSVQHFDSSYYTCHSSEIAAYNHPRVSHPVTPPAMYDPMLTCDICGVNFLCGEIQKASDHLNTVHPNKN